MKTSLYPKRNHLYAALKQMKHVNIIFNRKYSFIAYLMFDFQKTVFKEKPFFKNANDKNNLIEHNIILMCIPMRYNMQLTSMLNN